MVRIIGEHYNCRTHRKVKILKNQLPNQCKCTTVTKSPKEVIHQVFCIWYLPRAPGQWCLKRFERYISTAKWLVLKSLCYHDGWQMYIDCDWVSYHLYVQHNIYVTRSGRNPLFCFYLILKRQLKRVWYQKWGHKLMTHAKIWSL